MKSRVPSKREIVIVDGKSLVWRHAEVDRGRRAFDGSHVGGIHGAIQSIMRLRQIGAIAIAWEGSRPNWRLGHLPEYKANRVKRSPDQEEMSASVRAQCEDLKSVIPLLDDAIVQWAIEDGEGDDVIASLAVAYASKCTVTIYSKDRDLLQLVSESRIRQIIPNSSRKTAEAMFGDEDSEDLTFRHGRMTFGSLYDTRERVKTLLGVYPERLADFKALSGDAGDNIPGVKGIGKKTAIALIERYASLEEILSAADALEIEGSKGSKIAASKDIARISRIVALLPAPAAPEPFILRPEIPNSRIRKIADGIL